MNPTGRERFLMAVKAATPIFLAIGLMLLAMVPFHMAYPGIIVPNVVIILVYYWLIHRPDLMTPAIVFFIGLVQDFLSGGPPGLNALTLLAVSFFIIRQDDVLLRATFPLIWTGFAVTAMGAGVLSWLIASFYMGNVLNAGPILVQTFITIGFYPFFSWIFGRFRKSILG